MPNGQPGRVRNFFGRLGDRFVWGPNYNDQTGAWNASLGQYVGGIGSRIANGLFPGSGTAATMIYNGTQGTGPLRFIDGDIPRGSEIAREQFPVNFDPIGGGPRNTFFSAMPNPGDYNPSGFGDYGQGFGSGSSFGQFGESWAPEPTSQWGAFTPNVPAPAGGYGNAGGGAYGGGYGGGGYVGTVGQIGTGGSIDGGGYYSGGYESAEASAARRRRENVPVQET